MCLLWRLRGRGMRRIGCCLSEGRGRLFWWVGEDHRGRRGRLGYVNMLFVGLLLVTGNGAHVLE